MKNMVQLPVKSLLFVLNIPFLLPLKCKHTNAVAYTTDEQVASVGKGTYR